MAEKNYVGFPYVLLRSSNSEVFFSTLLHFDYDIKSSLKYRDKDNLMIHYSISTQGPNFMIKKRTKCLKNDEKGRVKSLENNQVMLSFFN